MKDKFSIIIPTMWYSGRIFDMLNVYDNTGNIDEVIIIDNNPSVKQDLFQFKKVKRYTKGHNIYVNPAWNWGVALSKNNNVILANDDVQVDNLADVVSEYLKSDYDVIGVDFENINKSLLVSKADKKEYGYGCFIYVKKDKYITLPYDMKIFRGDFFLQKCLNSGKMSGIKLRTEMSTSVNKHKQDATKDTHLYRTWSIGIKNESKDICFIIHSFNCKDYVLSVINTINKAFSNNYFMIIVDNCSIDSSKEMLDNLDKSRLMLVYNEEQLDYERNNRTAIKLAPISKEYKIITCVDIEWMNKQSLSFEDIKQIKYN